MVKKSDGFEGFMLSPLQIWTSQLIASHQVGVAKMSSFATIYFNFGLPFYYVFSTAPLWYRLAIFAPLQLSPWIVFLADKSTFKLLQLFIPCSVLASVCMTAQYVLAAHSQRSSAVSALVFALNGVLSAFAQADPFNPQSLLNMQEMWPTKGFDQIVQQITMLRDFTFGSVMRSVFGTLYVHQYIIWFGAALICIVKSFFRPQPAKSELQKILKE